MSSTRTNDIPKVRLRARFPNSMLLAQALPGNMCYRQQAVSYERPSSCKGRVVTKAVWLQTPPGSKDRLVTKILQLDLCMFSGRLNVPVLPSCSLPFSLKNAGPLFFNAQLTVAPVGGTYHRNTRPPHARATVESTDRGRRR